MSQEPEISVVIATHRRESRLAFALDALAAQTLGPDRFEVIVVRSSDEGPLTNSPDGLRVCFLATGIANISIQRNLGWRAARSRLIAFIDDDCRPTPDWLERMLAAWDGGDAILQGRIALDPDERHLAYGISRTVTVERLDRWYQTGNIAYPKALLERLGGFDEELVLHCEDSDLGLRAERAGARPTFLPDATVYHTVRVRRFRDAVAEAARWTGEPALIARYPSQRELLYARYFVHPDHAKLLLAAAGALCLPRSRLAAALLAYPYVHVRIARRLRGGVPGGWALARIVFDTAVEGALDSIEIAMRLPSSIRHRRVVL